MKPLKNKYLENKKYYCFGCSPDNPAGLKLEFFDDNGVIISLWNPDVKFTGYNPVVHGGIQATIIDETTAWAVDSRFEQLVVTKDLQVSYHKPLTINDGPIRTSTTIVSFDEKYVLVHAEMFTSSGILTTSGVVKFRLLSKKAAERVLNL